MFAFKSASERLSGLTKIDPRAWSTEALIEKIKESIEGRDRLGDVLVDFALGDGALHGFDVTLDEIEDWLDDVPLFDALTLYHKESGKRQNEVQKLQGTTQSSGTMNEDRSFASLGSGTTTLIFDPGQPKIS